ncbi:hypothetical protein DH2020_009820 [Rehmannia glutinosa]|uniref:Uncharacterized protein n=1 Tax=Rehmannia glutinosa TaxID=99300 RepID=A0ABR0X7D3_REHGL
MGVEVDDHCEPNSTPKLTLSKLPCKPIREPIIQMLTPPLHPSVSIPFRWEEAPGKPRSTAVAADPATETLAAAKNKVARCLDLPPRLLQDDAKITIMPSPATVLDGPYVGRSLSLACTFSFRKGPVIAGREEGLRPAKKSGGGNFGSGRWGSFRDEEKLDRGSFDLSHTLGEIFRRENNVKITRVRRRRSFFNLSTVNSNL